MSRSLLCVNNDILWCTIQLIDQKLNVTYGVQFFSWHYWKLISWIVFPQWPLPNCLDLQYKSLCRSLFATLRMIFSMLFWFHAKTCQVIKCDNFLICWQGSMKVRQQIFYYLYHDPSVCMWETTNLVSCINHKCA